MQKRSWKQMLVLLLAVCLFSTVSPELVSSAASTQKVQISARKMTLIKGQKKTLKLKGNRKKVKWSSTKKAVAAVSAKGVVTARKAGTTVIKAKVGTKTYSCKVIVEAPKLNKTSITLKEGSSCQLKMLGTRQKVKWSSSAKSVVTVSATGKVKAKQVKKDTSARITASVGGKKYSCKVLVKDVKAATPETEAPKPSQPETEAPKPSQPETEAPKPSQPEPEAPKPQTTGFARLKDYILTFGKENTAGNYFINMKNLYKGTNYTYGIVYNRVEDQLEFLFLTESSKDKSSMTMYVMENPVSAPTNYLFLMKNLSGGFEVKVNLNPATYDGESKIAFQVEKSVGGAPYQAINDLANATLQAGFAGWSKLLDYAGITFKDLGFVAYTG
ncbi:MAG: Ig-like domain-containing protein [Blautia sp.]|nr:Ig-like domain-containing protein [Blautia sp.]MDD5967558.1 Ig-like domain-containing protein [Blautia sp.]MDY2898621.1 Ig-like domain-containing protein [Candidatus Limivivens sp.]